MKFTTENNSITKATMKVQGAITDRNQAQISIKAERGSVYFYTADRNLAIYSNFSAEIEEAGVIHVQAKLFTEVVRELPPERITLRTEDSWLIVSGGINDSYTMKIPLIDTSTWKDLPDTSEDKNADIEANKLSYLINQVAFCVATESPRNYGNVAYLHKIDQHTLRLVGTDGYRLSHCDINVELPDQFLTSGLCIPKRALQELSKICQEGFEKINLSVSTDSTVLCAKVEGLNIFCRLSVIKFPNYQGVIPSNHPYQLSLSKPLIQSVTKRVMIAADKNKALLLSFSKDSLTLSSKTMGSTEGTESVPLDGYEGDDYQIAINGKYLSDVFTVTTSENLKFQFNNAEGPIVAIPSEEPEGCQSKHVIVPILDSH